MHFYKEFEGGGRDYLLELVISYFGLVVKILAVFYLLSLDEVCFKGEKVLLISKSVLIDGLAENYYLLRGDNPSVSNRSGLYSVLKLVSFLIGDILSCLDELGEVKIVWFSVFEMVAS